MNCRILRVLGASLRKRADLRVSCEIPNSAAAATLLMSQLIHQAAEVTKTPQYWSVKIAPKNSANSQFCQIC